MRAIEQRIWKKLRESQEKLTTSLKKLADERDKEMGDIRSPKIGQQPLHE